MVVVLGFGFVHSGERVGRKRDKNERERERDCFGIYIYIYILLCRYIILMYWIRIQKLEYWVYYKMVWYN